MGTFMLSCEFICTHVHTGTHKKHLCGPLWSTLSSPHCRGRKLTVWIPGFCCQALLRPGTMRFPGSPGMASSAPLLSRKVSALFSEENQPHRVSQAPMQGWPHGGATLRETPYLVAGLSL